MTLTPQQRLHLRNVNLAKVERSLAHLSPEQRVQRNRTRAAELMFRMPTIAIFPERWLADLFGGNGGVG